MVVRTKGSRLPTTGVTCVRFGGDGSCFKEDMKVALGLLSECEQRDMWGAFVLEFGPDPSCDVSRHRH